MNDQTDLVTGAFGYLGKYMTEILTKKGIKVRTMTGHPDRQNPFGEMVSVVPYHFDQPARLVADLEGITTVFNTYWVRFNYGDVTFSRAVANTKNLIHAAREAGVKRFVHISITNPSLDSDLPYFSGKAVLEDTLVNSGLSHAVIRPTVLFGREDILINNIAWLLKRFPVFGVFGDGDYRIQPVYVGDVAALAVELAGRGEDVVCDAIGPETYTFDSLVRLIREGVGSRSMVMHVPTMVAHLVGRLVGPLVRDVVITRQEIEGLMAGLLVSEARPTCPTRFSRWLDENADELGLVYSSELERHYQ